jgi:hypothetical protein
MNTAQQRGRRILLLIAATFLLPIALAAYMYYSGSNWLLIESTTNGELITPPRTLPDTLLTSGADPKQLYGHWNLAVLADAQCDALCTQALEHIRQIRLSLGPKMPRVQTLYLPRAVTAIPEAVATEHPALIVVAPDVSTDIRRIVGEYNNGQIFLVDPLGNLMMQYTPDASMGDVRKDLGHLLKLSGIG